MAALTSLPVLAPPKSTPIIAGQRVRAFLAEFAGLAILLLFCGFVFYYGLNTGELYRTESLRAIVAQEFLRSGNWIVPTLYGEALLTKPPGMYAAIALLSWPLGGVTEWTARLPSALSATAVVFMFYGFFRRQLGRRQALIVALVTPLSLMWLDKATAAEIDMMQVAWVTGAILSFLRALEISEDEGGSKGAWSWWLTALLCVAGGFLTKWTAPAFFYGTVIPLLWWRRRLRLLWRRQHLGSVALAAGIGFAWVAAVVAGEGWHSFYTTVSREALMRLSPGHHHRPYPWGETISHPLRVFVATLPGSAFALFALRPGFAVYWSEGGRRILQAMHCWIWPNLLFWSVVPEHSVRHSFPLFPAVSCLAALVWVDWYHNAAIGGSTPSRWKPAPVLIGVLVAWLLLKTAFVHAVVPARNKNREPRAKGEWIAATVPAGETLFLFRLKDEGIMFYYGRTVRRLSTPAELPSADKERYCILSEPEWKQWNDARPAQPLLHLRDEQGDPIVLVRVARATSKGNP